MENMKEKIDTAECAVTLFMNEGNISIFVAGDISLAYEMIKITAFALKNKQKGEA
jgi:hypothetical protein